MEAKQMSAYSPRRKTEHLLKLSEDVSRIAGTLARLSVDRDSDEDLPPTVVSDIPAERVKSVILARRLRGRFFPEDLFADPAWDMMLDLLYAELIHQRVAVSSLCVAAAVPATTALRWLNTLVKQQIVVRRDDPHDGRRVFIELSPHASSALRRYFAEVEETI
jgi:hypothetical protein